jgi:hypothetical protein
MATTGLLKKVDGSYLTLTDSSTFIRLSWLWGVTPIFEKVQLLLHKSSEFIKVRINPNQEL